MVSQKRKDIEFSINSEDQETPPQGGVNIAAAEAERELRLYKTILSTTPDLVYVFDLAHRFTYANTALLQMWGKTWEEAAGKNCLELGYEPWHAEMHDREIDEVVATKKSIRGEVPFAGTNGRRIYDYIFVPVLDESGEVEAVAGTTREITEKKAVEETVRRKAALIELSYEPIFAWDLDDGIVEWNRGAEDLYGYISSEVLGQSSHSLLGTVHPNGFEEYFTFLKANGYWSGRIEQRAKDGRKLKIESKQQLISSAGRQLVLETNRDITGSTEAEGILERYRLLSENSRDIIWFLSPDGRFIDVNQAAIDVYGYSREEFLDLHITDLRHPGTRTEMSRQFEKALDGDVHFETVHVRKDGSPVPVDVSASGARFGDDYLIMAIVRDISERKAAESALKASEERRQLAQQAGNVGIWDWDVQADQTYWSETMWLIFGEKPRDINPDEIYWSKFLHPSDRDRVKASVKAAIETTTSTQFRDEYRIIRQDGAVRWIAAVAQISRDERGRPVRMYGVNLDVTEHKEAEERIRLSESQLRLVTNAVPALISYVDASERYRFANQKFTDWFGIPTEEIVGKKVKDIFGVKAYRVLKSGIDTALSGRQSTFETSLSYKVVGTKYVHVSYMPDIGVDGTVYGYYGLTHDLTDLKRSEELLRSREDQLKLMMESLYDYAIFSMDRDGNIDTWNKGAAIIFGYSADEIIGRTADILFTEEDKQRAVHLRELRAARKKGRTSDDRWLLRKDGTRFFASSTTMSLNVGQSLEGYAKIASDLTEKQRFAEELQAAHDELELRVRERTRELAEANAALLQEIADRETAEKQRTDLLQRLVTSQELERRRIARDLHDQLGQRLTALRLKIASLKEFSVDDERFSVRVGRLQQISERLDSEVSFLAWELRPTALDDLGLVDAVGAFVNEWSRHYEIRAEFHSTGLGKERVDRETETHLYRITQEALNNILKHAKAQNVTVLLERRGNGLTLIIEDDGVGFDSEAKRTRSKSGSGLGLVGMQERASLIGGEAEIETGIGKGTTIYVRIPLNG